MSEQPIAGTPSNEILPLEALRKVAVTLDGEISPHPELHPMPVSLARRSRKERLDPSSPSLKDLADRKATSDVF